MHFTKKTNFLIIAFLPLMITSCVVSKKKYEELEYAKRRSDSKVRTLTKENEGLNNELDNTLSEFNEMRNSMAESNAMKTSEIDALSTEVMGLTSDTIQLKERWIETVQLYNEAKDKNLNNTLKISELEEAIKVLRADSSDLVEDLKNFKIDVEWDKKKLDSENNSLAGSVKQKENEIASLNKDLEEVKGKNSWLRKVIDKNKQEIEKLSNQVKLYKKELDKASKKKRK